MFSVFNDILALIEFIFKVNVPGNIIDSEIKVILSENSEKNYSKLIKDELDQLKPFLDDIEEHYFELIEIEDIIFKVKRYLKFFQNDFLPELMSLFIQTLNIPILNENMGKLYLEDKNKSIDYSLKIDNWKTKIFNLQSECFLLTKLYLNLHKQKRICTGICKNIFDFILYCKVRLQNFRLAENGYELIKKIYLRLRTFFLDLINARKEMDYFIKIIKEKFFIILNEQVILIKDVYKTLVRFNNSDEECCNNLKNENEIKCYKIIIDELPSKASYLLTLLPNEITT